MLEVTQEGFVGGAPELRYTPGGEPVATISVASTKRWKDKSSGDEKEQTTWVKWECWGASAENLSKIVKKGSRLLVRGSIRNHQWTDTASGEPRYRDRYVIEWWRLLDRRPEDRDSEGSGEPPTHDE